MDMELDLSSRRGNHEGDVVAFHTESIQILSNYKSCLTNDSSSAQSERLEVLQITRIPLSA